MSQTTKNALARSLKTLAAEKPLDKITISDITEDCGVNRQTFYYHFKDIYDLVEWTYTSDAMRAIGEKKTYDTWQQGFLQVFAYVARNKAFVLHTYHSVSREFLEKYLYEETYRLLRDVLEEKSVGLALREEDKAFIASFYKYGFVGLVLDWIGSGMRAAPEALVEKLELVIHGSFRGALERFRTDGP